MARQWTKEETARGWLVAAQGEEVDAPPMPPRLPVAKGIGLHPEADARLAAATGGQPLRVDAWIGDYGTAVAPDGTRVTVKRNADGTISRASEARYAVVKGDKVDADAIPASPSDGKAYRIEAAVNNGPTFALVGTLAEIDARLRSGFVGVDVATGETGKASEWPMVAAKMRAHLAARMADDPRREPASEPLTLHPSTRLDAITIGGLPIRCPVVESGSPEGFIMRAQVTRETCCALQAACCNGKPVDIEANGRTRRAVVVKYNEQRAYFTRADFDVTIEMRWWVDAVPSMTWNGVPAPDAPVDTARAAAPAKPAALAAEQVWERTVGHGTKQRRTFVRPDERIGGRWFCEEHPNDWIDAWCMLTMPEWHYLGTREEVAAAERAAHPMQVVTAPYRLHGDVLPAGVAREGEAVFGVGPEPIGRVPASPLDFTGASPTLTNRDESIKAIHDSVMARLRERGTDAQRAREALNHLRHALCAALATDNVTTDLDFATATVTVTAPGCGAADIARAIEGAKRWAPSGCEVVAAPSASPYREAPPLSPKAQAIIDECNGIASRMSDAWSSPSPGTRDGLRRIIARALDVSPEDVTIHESSPGVVDVEVRGMGARRVEEAIEAMRDHLPLGAAALRVWRPVPPLAALRATIDALIAADAGPFAHARAAALRCLSEPGDLRTPQRPEFAIAYLRTYEERRGGGRVPHEGARLAALYAVGERAIAVYERERARSDAYARPSR